MTRKVLKYSFIIFILIILFYSIYIKYFSKRIISQPFGFSILLIASGSMEPEIKRGDIVIIKKSKKYEIGDIVTYSANDKYLITHRIIAKDGDAIITKGDNNNIQDEKIEEKDIYGKVILRIGL